MAVDEEFEGQSIEEIAEGKLQMIVVSFRN